MSRRPRRPARREAPSPDTTSDLLVVPGLRPLALALAHAPGRVRRLWLARPLPAEVALPPHVEVEEVTRDALDARCGDVRHGGLVAAVEPPSAPTLAGAATAAATAGPLLVLDGVTDPRNLGAMLRCAAWFGCPAVITPSRRSAPLTVAAVAASAGAACAIPILRVTNLARTLDALADRGVWIVAADPEGQPLSSTAPLHPAALVIGDEGRGVRPNVLRRAELRVAIAGAPPAGLDSLNAAVACGVLLQWSVGAGMTPPAP